MFYHSVYYLLEERCVFPHSLTSTEVTHGGKGEERCRSRDTWLVFSSV